MKKNGQQSPLIKETLEKMGDLAVSDTLIHEFVKDFFPKVNDQGAQLFDANGNISVGREERDMMIGELTEKFGDIFNILRIDRNDSNSMNTPHRLAKMWVNELFAG